MQFKAFLIFRGQAWHTCARSDDKPGRGGAGVLGSIFGEEGKVNTQAFN